MYPSEQAPRLMVRIPADLKLWMEKKAKREATSQSALVVQALRLMQETAAARQSA